MDVPTANVMTSVPPLEDSALPVPIHHVAHHYYLYHAPTIARLRADHHILGSAVGTLPQANQQNVFLGLPLMLLPEEARLLCERGVGFLVDDHEAHKEGLRHLQDSSSGKEQREMFVNRLDDIGRGIGETIAAEKAKERQAAMSKFGAEEMQKRAKRAQEKKAAKAGSNQKQQNLDLPDIGQEEVESQPDREDQGRKSGQTSSQDVEVYSLTPATSHPPLQSPETPDSVSLPAVPSSYALYRYLHQKGYFMHPGLRFGCQYMAYPGDPLRFHSHFLVLSREWDEEIKLSTIIGSGRLGTGVKKGFLLGGHDPSPPTSAAEAEGGNVRCFSIEWGGM